MAALGRPSMRGHKARCLVSSQQWHLPSRLFFVVRTENDAQIVSRSKLKVFGLEHFFESSTPYNFDFVAIHTFHHFSYPIRTSQGSCVLRISGIPCLFVGVTPRSRRCGHVQTPFTIELYTVYSWTFHLNTFFLLFDWFSQDGKHHQTSYHHGLFSSRTTSSAWGYLHRFAFSACPTAMEPRSVWISWWHPQNVIMAIMGNYVVCCLITLQVCLCIAELFVFLTMNSMQFQWRLEDLLSRIFSVYMTLKAFDQSADTLCKEQRGGAQLASLHGQMQDDASRSIDTLCWMTSCFSLTRPTKMHKATCCTNPPSHLHMQQFSHSM